MTLTNDLLIQRDCLIWRYLRHPATCLGLVVINIYNNIGFLYHSSINNHIIFVLLAPSAPTPLSYVGVPPSSSHGPRIILSWSKPTEPNGVIRSYNLFYRHDGGAPVKISGIDKNAFSHTVDVLGGVTYQFHVRAVTIKPGPNETITVTTKEYGVFLKFTVM